MPEDQEQLSDKDIADVVASMISDEDLRVRSQALDDAQEAWEEVCYLANPKMPCPECTGAGQVSGGSLGNMCVRCMGARVIEQPGSTPVEMPPFAELRAAITQYGNAKADHELPPGHRARRNLALPPPTTVPTLDQITQLHGTAIGMSRQLANAPQAPQAQLPEAKPPRGLAGEGDLGEYEDAELDELEDKGEKPGTPGATAQDVFNRTKAATGKPMFKRPIPKKGPRK